MNEIAIIVEEDLARIRGEAQLVMSEALFS